MRVSNVTVRRRLFFILLAGTLLFAGLLVRLAYVQLWKGKQLAAEAEDNWRRQITVMPKRGEIWDRNGTKLTYNISTPTVMAVPAQVEDAKAVAERLAAVLDMPADDIYKLLKKSASSVYIKPAGRKITQEKAQQIREMNLPGIIVTEDNKRFYPYGSLAAHVLGFTGIDNQGLMGVEATYDKQMTGVKGYISYLSQANGDKMPGSTSQFAKPLDGLNLQLTIDYHLQSVVERELQQAMIKYQAEHAIAIMMDPNNGEVLAMAGYPTFEPSHFRDYPVETYNRDLPIWMTYEPGSTFKIITLAAALNEKKVDLKNEFFHDPGAIEVGGARLRCWKRGGHGSESFLEVVENSCNPGFVVLGQRLGKETLFDYINRFGFGKKTGIDLGGEENGILFKPSRVGPVELATTAFGQGVSVTPIQQVAAVSAAINGGRLFQPHVGKALINPDNGEVVQRMEPKLVRDNVISADTSKQVREALESVVAQGTGKNAFIDGYRVGGKTGTAQKVIGGRYSPTEHIVSFIGFAPADNPRIVVYAAVDNPQGLQFGGLIAAPLVKNIMAESLRYLKVEPSKKQLPREYTYGDTTPQIVEVPNLIGATIEDILEDMNDNFLLAKSGTGNTVVNQVPKPGTRVEKGSTIRVYLADTSQ
ncbi:stage V sporulation protein D [Gordoniibacillus kamchatkensis]|uniref:Stage V sporulation protein D n=1 Tax=Gordoniibacillus kamchatkensis TaxID=1590651 RepID=A0ABR5AL05_9BACL|nr:stage V sporulation protein D [Paenibacillus sp. VKM B-2647]KIL41745.1 stage V sporulation protein D [Paenibacillus sp. VKM B-2647]